MSAAPASGDRSDAPADTGNGIAAAGSTEHAMGGSPGPAVLVGLTGAYCAGKNAAAGILEERGFRTLDVDKLGHRALNEAAGELAERFGSTVVRPDGTVDRAALGALAFADPGVLKILEAIVHPRVLAMAESWIAQGHGERLVLNAALLHRMPAMASCDFVLLVRAPLAVRLRRARARDGLSPLAALKRFWSQRGFEAQYFRKGADIYIVENRATLADMARQIDTILALKGMDR